MTNPKKSPELLSHSRTRARLLLLALWLPATASAAEIRSVAMDKNTEGYAVRAVSWLAAPPAFVYSVLLDYDEFHRLTGGITSSRWLHETDAGLPLAYTRIDSCVAFFCRTLEKVERVHILGDLQFATEALPGRSDFKRYASTWRLQAEANGTLITYETTMQPAFWVPPLIGPWAIRRKAESSALKIAQRIEYLAATKTPLQAFDLEAYRRLE